MRLRLIDRPSFAGLNFGMTIYVCNRFYGLSSINMEVIQFFSQLISQNKTGTHRSLFRVEHLRSYPALCSSYSRLFTEGMLPSCQLFTQSKV